MTKDAVAQYLTELKERKGWSVREWAEQSGVAEKTIYRLLRGENDLPAFYNVGMLVKTAGGSLDELAGIEREPLQVVRTEYKTPPHLDALLTEKDKIIEFLEAEKQKMEAQCIHAEAAIHKLRIGRTIRNVVIGVFLVVSAALITWDLMDPRYGFLYRIMSSLHEGSAGRKWVTKG